jgi:hypothetical protein
MLDWHLPDAPSRKDRAWMSMPISEPVRSALSGRTLEQVVSAVAAFSRTLADIGAEYGIAHRDIKPGNLYSNAGHWAVGDLGLVDVPGAEALTEPDRIVGPANFVAYEMMVSAGSADPFQADVYSMAKTLWVLATDQLWPPPGHQPSTISVLSVGKFRAHPRAETLDLIIDRSTRAPELRPSMSALADELDAWLAEPQVEEPEELNLDDIAASIRSSLAPREEEQRTSEELADEAQESADFLGTSFEPLISAVEKVAPMAERNVDEEIARTLVGPIEAMGTPSVKARWLVSARAVGPGQLPIAFRLLAGLALLDDGTVYLAGAYLVAPEKVLGNLYSRQYESFVGPPGGLATRQAIEKLASDMRADFRDALSVFSEALRGNG